MSTHCLICDKHANKNSTGIYCHSDGYSENAGLILYKFYNTKESVEDLLSLGDLSRLGFYIGEKMDFNENFTDYEYYKEHAYQCVAYCRDREEDLHKYENTYNTIRNRASESYNYVFSDDGNWYTWKYGSEETRLLSDILKENEYVCSLDMQKSWLEDETIPQEFKDKIFEALKDLGILHEELLEKVECNE